jgi:ClpP class serine protease
MKFQRIIDAFYRQPLDITVGGFEAVDAVLRPYLVMRNPKMKDGDFIAGETDVFGQPLPQMLEVNHDTGLATVHVNGPLLQHAALIDKSCGACSYQDIDQALEEAMGNDGARKILLRMDSPGGQHCGAIELAEKIAEIANGGQKEIFAFTDATMASACYCLAAGCNGIFTTRTSYVGCIGSLIAFMDFSKLFETQGIKPVVFASGKYKGAGIEGTSLTDDQAEYLMGLVETAAGQFKDHVRANRAVAEESMEGQSMYGEDAVAAGLADYLVRDLDEVEEFLGGK